MAENDARLVELKRQFQHSDFRFDIVQWSVRKYEAEPDPEERDFMLGAWWNWSLSQRWAWDVLTELFLRALESSEPIHPILRDFGRMSGRGELRPPDEREGRPSNDMNENLDILATVHVLVKHYDFTKTAAYNLVAEWETGRTAGGRGAGAIRKLVGKMATMRPFPRGKVARK